MLLAVDKYLQKFASQGKGINIKGKPLHRGVADDSVYFEGEISMDKNADNIVVRGRMWDENKGSRGKASSAPPRPTRLLIDKYFDNLMEKKAYLRLIHSRCSI